MQLFHDIFKAGKNLVPLRSFSGISRSFHFLSNIISSVILPLDSGII